MPRRRVLLARSLARCRCEPSAGPSRRDTTCEDCLLRRIRSSTQSFNRFNLQPWVKALYMDRGPAPQGLQNSAQGFNPGNPQNKRFALKGREMRVPDEARTYRRAKSEWAIGMCDNWTIGPRFRLVRTFDLAPPSGRVALGGRFPGLKPWAEFCSPCGAQNKGLSPRIVAYSPLGAKSSYSLS